MFLEELLQSPDFGSAVRHLACPFRERWGLPEVRQLGLVVPDVESAADALARRNIGPFFICWRIFGQRFVPPGPVLRAVGSLERRLGFRLRA